MPLYQNPPGIYLLLLLLTLGASCKRNLQDAMQFQVNPELIGIRQYDSLLQISYASPVGFMTSTHEQAIRQGAISNRPEEVDIRAVYQHEASQAFMVVSAITEAHWKQLSSLSKEQFSATMWTNISATTYRHKNFEVHQWLLQNQEWIHFKFLFRTERNCFFQLDYLLPVSQYNEDVAKAVESSIGSFTSL